MRLCKIMTNIRYKKQCTLNSWSWSFQLGISLGHLMPIKPSPHKARLLCLDFSTQHEAVNTKHLILINWLYLFCGLPSRGVEHISLTQHQVPTPRRVHWCIMLLRGFEKDLKPYNNGTLRIMTRHAAVFRKNWHCGGWYRWGQLTTSEWKSYMVIKATAEKQQCTSSSFFQKKG